MKIFTKKSTYLSNSFWEYQEIFEGVDFCIVGAGIVGSCTAIFLREEFPDAKILILERGMLPKGASTKNAGFACFGSVSEILDDHNSMSSQEISELIKLRVDGLELLKSLCAPESMDYNSFGGYEVFDDASANVYEAKIEEYNTLIEQASGLKNCFSLVENKFNFNFGSKMIFNQYEGQLNPVKMLMHLHRRIEDSGTKILFGAEIQSMVEDGPSLKIIDGPTLNPNSLILCTNAFSKKFLPKFNLKPARNQVLVSKPIEDLKLKGTFHYDKGYVYFRNIGDRLLIGGGRNIDAEKETTEQFGGNETIKKYLMDLVHDKILPNTPVQIDYEWSGIIAVGDKKVPHIKQINKNLYAAFRLGGMGVAIGSKVAQNLTKLVVSNR